MTQRLKEQAIGLVMGLSIAFTPVSGFSAPAFSFYGTWRIDALVGYSDISIDPDVLRKLVGRYVVISRERLKIGDDDCQISRQSHPRELTMETAWLLREGYGADRKDAGVPARTRVLRTESCGDVFRSGNDIVVSEGGAFFRASRVTGRPAGNRKP